MGLLEEELTALASKKKGVVFHRNSISTIAAGSSHGDYGFDPARIAGSYNLCSTSQDLYYSLAVYRWCLGHLPKLRNVVLFYSLFSPGFNMVKTSERVRSVAWKMVFGIDPPSTDPGLSSLEVSIQTPPSLNECGPDQAYDFGFIRSNSRYFFSSAYTAKRRAMDHAKFGERAMTDCPMLSYLSEMAEVADTNGHRLIVVVPPSRVDYREHLLPATHFGALEKLAIQKKFAVLNLFDSDEFAFSDFGDFDHLKPDGLGPARLTDKVLQVLKD